jgi:hypothetical protein
VLVLGARAVRELVQVRLADVRVARVLEQANGLGGLRRDALGEDRRAIGRRQAGRIEQIFDRESKPRAWLLRPREDDSVEADRQSSAR